MNITPIPKDVRHKRMPKIEALALRLLLTIDVAVEFFAEVSTYSAAQIADFEISVSNQGDSDANVVLNANVVDHLSEVEWDLFAGFPVEVKQNEAPPDTVVAINGDTFLTSFGNAVENGGDLNSDGISDLIVMAEDSAVVVYGSEKFSGLARDETDGPNGFKIDLPSGTRHFMQSADVNGDGFDDLLASTGCCEGSREAFIVLGSDAGVTSKALLSPQLLNAERVTRLVNNQSVAGFNPHLREIGDFNGDGIGDFAAGVSGKKFRDIYVLFGEHGNRDSATIDLLDLATDQGFVIGGIPVNEPLTLSGAGDLNNDGIEDLIVGRIVIDQGRTSSERP